MSRRTMTRDWATARELRNAASAPKLVIKRRPESIFAYEPADFELMGYQAHSAIKAPIAV